MSESKWIDLHSSFLDWAASHHPRDSEEILGVFFDTGEYPEEFLAAWREQVSKIPRPENG